MATFPAKYFLTSTKYPDSGTRIQMGRSYTFNAPSASPDLRIFTLTLAGMQYFLDGAGAIDLTVHTDRNMAVLDEFYRDHQTHLSFDFNHPVYGTLQCKFNRPLEIPNGLPGGNGVVESFSVELIEIP